MHASVVSRKPWHRHAAPLMLAGVVSALPLYAQTLPPPENVVNLNASATVEVASDWLTVVFSTTREGPEAGAVQTQLKQALDAALAEARRIAKPGDVEVRTGGFSIQQVPWDREDRHNMPVSVWRDLISQHFPNTGWLRLDRDTVDALAGYRSAHGLLSQDEAIMSLLSQASEEAR